MTTIIVFTLFALWLGAAVAVGETRHKIGCAKVEVGRLRLELFELNQRYHRQLTDAVHHLRELEGKRMHDNFDKILQGLPRDSRDEVWRIHMMDMDNSYLAAYLMDAPVPFDMVATYIEFKAIDLVFNGDRRRCWERGNWLLVPWSRAEALHYDYHNRRG